MKHLIFFFGMICLAFLATAQTLTGPSSMVWDAEAKVYYVVYDNLSSPDLPYKGRLVSFDPIRFSTEILSEVDLPFASGIAMVGNEVFVSTMEGLKAFIKGSWEEVWSFEVENASDLCSDDAGNVYVAYLAKGLIQKINAKTKQISNLCMGQISKPKGISWDAQNEVLLVSTYGNQPPAFLYSVDPQSGEAEELMDLDLSYVSQAVADRCGNIYVSTSNSVHKVKADFSQVITVKSGMELVEDIYLNEAEGALGIPSAKTNQIVFLNGLRDCDDTGDFDLAVEIVSPLHTSMIKNAANVHLVWKPAKLAKKYQYQVSEEKTFRGAEKIETSNSEAYFTGATAERKTFYFRVRASDGEKWREWSDSVYWWIRVK